jgi:hypothetical protein
MSRSIEEAFASVIDSMIGGTIAQAELQGLQVTPLDEARLMALGARLGNGMREALAIARTYAGATLMPARAH